MFPIRPEIINAAEVTAKIGADYNCPYCTQSTREEDEDIGWGYCPMRPGIEKWICLGCIEDIYSTCLSLDYLSHAYRDIVQNAARQDGIDELTYRLLCLKEQLATLVRSGRPPNPNIPSREFLESLIADLERHPIA